MSDSVSKKVLAVRTYANDLAETRAVRDHTDNTTVTTKATVAILPAAITTIAHTTPTAVSGAAQKLVFTEPKSKKEIPEVPTTDMATNKIATPAKNTIPPFHTFQKPAVTVPAKPTAVTKISVPASISNTQPKTSILTNPSHGVSVGDEADAATEATVITDTKRSKFSLTAAVTKSMSGWFQDKKDTITGKNKPKYTVPQADRRKGVIQKATSMTGRTSTADHTEVLKRLRANKQNAGIVPITKPKVATSEPTWVSAEPAPTPTAPNILPVQTVSSEPVIVQTPKPVAVLPIQKIKPTIPEVISVTKPLTNAAVIPPTPPRAPEVLRPKITPITPALPQVATVPRAEIVPIVLATTTIPRVAPPVISAPTVSPIVRPLITPTVPAIPRSMPTIITPPVAEMTPVATPPPAAAPVAVAATKKSIMENKRPKISLRFQLQNIFTHTDRIVISGGIVATGIIIAGLGYRYYLQSGSNTSPIIQAVAEAPVFSQMITDPTPVIATSKGVVVAALQTAAAAPDSLTEVSFIDPISSTTLQAETLFSLFGVTTLTAFKSSITKVSLGAYRGEPWLLLRVTDAPTAQGGMFDWESRMSNDLSPWYGTAVAAKKTTITAFIDNTVSGVDVRILLDEQKKERITYGFVAPNYILITTTASAWLNLREHWRAE